MVATIGHQCSNPTPHAGAQMVADEYNDLFGGQVVSVQPVHETSKLEKLDAKYDKASQKLWDMVGDYSNKKRNNKKIKRKQARQATSIPLPAYAS